MPHLKEAPSKEQPQSLRPFLTIWIGQALSLIGSELVSFALIWWMTRQTGSAIVLTTATTISLLPRLFLLPFAGTLVDRWKRRSIMFAADSMIALVTLLLAFLFMFDIAQLWHIYVLLFLRSLGSVFHRPAMMASTTLMVPDKQLSRVAGLNETLSGILSVLSPILGAVLIELLPMQSILMIDVVTAAFAIVPLLFISIPQPKGWQSGSAGRKTAFFEDFKAGLRYTWSWKGLMVLVVVYALVHFFFTPAMSLIPLLITDHYHGGALELSWLQSAVGLGLISGGLLLSFWGVQKNHIMISMVAMLLVGVMVLLMGYAPANIFWLAVIGAGGLGITVSFVTGLRRVILQAVVPPEMQGRVFSLISAGMVAMDPLGLMIAGPLTETLHVQVWFLIAGVGIILLSASTFFIPAVAKMEQITPQLETEPE